MGIARQLPGAAVDLLLGSVCVGCARPGPVLCLACRAWLEQLPFEAWPTPCPPGLPRPFAVAPYDGAVKAAVVAHKERAALALARPLGRALALSVMAVLAAAAAVPGPVGLVPPAPSPAASRARGHDPLGRVLHSCVASLRAAGVPTTPLAVLERVRPVADQAGLSACDRTVNLAGAFRVRRRGADRVAGHAVVVVDDVLTSGATAAEVARAVGDRDASVLGVAVVAATVLRRPGVAPA